MGKARFIGLKPESSKIFGDLSLRNRSMSVLALPAQVVMCMNVTMCTQVCSEIANLNRFASYVVGCCARPRRVDPRTRVAVHAYRYACGVMQRARAKNAFFPHVHVRLDRKSTV